MLHGQDHNRVSLASEPRCKDPITITSQKVVSGILLQHMRASSRGVDAARLEESETQVGLRVFVWGERRENKEKKERRGEKKRERKKKNEGREKPEKKTVVTANAETRRRWGGNG